MGITVLFVSGLYLGALSSCLLQRCLLYNRNLEVPFICSQRFSLKLGACPPFFEFNLVGDGMFGSLSLAYNASPCHHCPPPIGGDLTSQHHGFAIAADSQEDDYYVHEGP